MATTRRSSPAPTPPGPGDAPFDVAGGVWVRWMVRRDIAGVLAADPGMTEAGLLGWLRDRSTVAMMAEGRDGAVAGYAVYRYFPDRIRLLRLCVAPGRRRQGVGRRLLLKVLSKVNPHLGRKFLEADVPGAALDVMLLFRACGGQAVGCDHAGDTVRFVFLPARRG